MQRFLGAIPGFGHQLAGGIRVIFDLEGRFTAPRTAGLVDAGRFGHIAAEIAFKLRAVQAQVGGFAHANIFPRRALFEGELPRPQVRLGVGVDFKALGFNLIDRIRGRGFDPVHLLREQRRGAGVGFRQRDQHHFIHPRNAIFVPVVGVFIEDQLLAGNQFFHFERTAAHRVGGEFGPRLLTARGGIASARRHRVVQLLPRGRRHDKQVSEVIWQQRVRFGGGQRHGVVVNLFRAGESRHARQRVADLAGRILRRGFIQHLIHVPDDGVGVDRRTIVKFNSRAQGENPAALILRVNVPLGRQPRHQAAGFLSLRQIPFNQGVVKRNAGKAVALKTLIGLSEGQRDIGGGHGDPQG